MNIINKTFQQGEFNFLMLKPAIHSCQVGLGKIARDDLVLKKLQKRGSKRYKTELSHFTEADAALMIALTKRTSRNSLQALTIVSSIMIFLPSLASWTPRTFLMRLKNALIRMTYKLRSCAPTSSCRRLPRSCTSTALSSLSITSRASRAAKLQDICA